MNNSLPPIKDKLSAVKQAFLALDAAESELAALKRERTEPIAVVGIGCRLPGNILTAQDFWRCLREGRNAVVEIPKDRWDITEYFDPDPEVRGKMSTRWGAFIDSVDQFDADFFGITPREARSMDPQQRILLEVAWQALEDAGHANLEELEGSSTGVFVGVTTDDYAQLMMQAQGLKGIDTYFASGTARSIVSGRLAYQFGLVGPAVSIDTACSSSLLAVHQACRSLLDQECQMAIAAGVNLMLSPANTVALSQYQMMAPDGCCKVFDSAADGFVRGEGCAAVVLKRLSHAQTAGDHIYACILGTAANQDGPSSGLTAPNGPSQVAVMQASLKRAKIKPSQVGYVETHGTGTALGDPIEARAIGQCYAAERSQDNPLVIGSVKTNIGHLEAAAGVAGLIKAVLVLFHREIPPNLHFNTPHPEIPWDRYPMKVPTRLMPLSRDGQTAYAGVSSLGFSGTNVHAVLSCAPAIPSNNDPEDGPQQIVTLSAKNPFSLRQHMKSIANWLGENPAMPLKDAAYSLAVGRTHHAYRVAMTGNSSQEIQRKIDAFLCDQPDSIRAAESSDRPMMAFLYTGQGAQYPGMGNGLRQSHPRFRKSISECDAILRPLLGRSIEEILYPAADDSGALIHQTEFTQPAMFVVAYALSNLWSSWGIQPDFVLGHSLGEYAAACVSGIVTLKDALSMVVQRARLMQTVNTRGAMAAVMATEDQVAHRLAAYADTVSIAAVNGPAHVVISGVAEDVDRLSESFRRDGVSVVPLVVSHAFHSPLMEPVLASFEKSISGVRFNAPKLRFVSNVSGAVASGEDVANPGYWRRHARKPVRFMDGIKTLVHQGCRLFIEIGPKPVLLNMGRRCTMHEGLHWLPSLDSKTDDWERILDSLAAVYVAGANVDWQGFYAPSHRRRISLPTYSFLRRRFWFTDNAATAGRCDVRHDPTVMTGTHPLLGTRMDTASGRILFRSIIGRNRTGFFKEHRVFGTASLPIAAVLEAALAAARLLCPQGGFPQLEQVTMDRVIQLPENGAVEMEWMLDPCERGYTFRLYSRPETLSGTSNWQEHAFGTIKTGEDQDAGPEEAYPIASLEALQQRCPNMVESDLFYDNFSRIGLDFGLAFHTLETLWSGDGEAIGRLCHRPDAPDANSEFVLSPLAMDGALQVVAAALMEGPIDKESAVGVHLPVGVDHVRLSRVLDGPFWAHAVIRERVTSISRTVICDVRLMNAQSQEIVLLSGCRLLPVHAGVLAAQSEFSLKKLLYYPSWQPLAGSDISAPETTVSLEAVEERMKRALPALAQEHRFAAYERACGDMDRLVGRYIIRAMEQLGWHPEPGQWLLQDDLAETLQVAGRHRQLFKRFLDILCEEGFLESAGAGGYRVVRAFPGKDSGPAVGALTSGSEIGKTEFDLIVRCGERLPEVLQGKADPLDILYQEEAFASVISLYKDSVTARIFNGLLQEGLDEAFGSVGPNRQLRILEIGAGTGGTTQYVLEALSGHNITYLFTDISPAFVQAAKQQYTSRPGFQGQVLDIEKDLATQGLANRQFDLVIAANVLHATADLGETLRRVHALTAPGGLLMLLEVTEPQRWIDITFGLTEGWWRFTDHERRADYPLISCQKWEELLRTSGFHDTLAVPDLDLPVPYGRLHLEALIVARKAEAALGEIRHVEAGTVAAQRWIVLSDNKELGGNFCQYAEQQNIRTTLMAFDQLDAKQNPASSEGGKILASAISESSGMPPRQEGSHRTKIIFFYDGDQVVEMDEAADPLILQKTMLAPLLDLLKALRASAARQYPQLIFATRDAQSVSEYEPTRPQGASLWGAVRAVMLEHPEFHCRLIDLDASAGVEQLFKACFLNDAENQVAVRGQQFFGLRLLPWGRLGTRESFQGDSPRQLDITARGLLDNLFWREVEKRTPGRGQVKIRVETAGLNFRDVLNALGTYAGGAVPFGGECAGTVVEVGAGVEEIEAGDRVLAIASNSFCSEVIADQHLVWRIPGEVSFVQAGSLAIAYTTSAYALRHLAGIRPGQSVLIHAATGGVGLAAVYLARNAGAQIFATAGNAQKRSFLQRLGVAHVMDSRTLDFADQVMTATGGWGVDIVLNALAGDFIEKSLAVTARGGMFLEIGRSGIMSPEEVGRKRPDVTYHAIDLTDTMDTRPETIRPVFDEVLQEIRAGSVPLLPCRVFPIDGVADAFRFMARARHIGKIVLRWPRHSDRKGILVRSDSTFWVTGGLGALGMFTAKWLASQGAAHIVLTGRRQPTPEVEKQIVDIRNIGTNVSVLTADVSHRDEVERVLGTIRKDCPPLRGIIHAAGVLDDGVLQHQSWERFEKVLKPKLAGAWNLHRATRNFPLDFMVFYSSVAGFLGSSGQTNHCAASAFIDSLAHMRHAAGLPCLSIDWGAWGEAGAAVGEDARSRADVKGVERFSPETGIQLLEYLLQEDKPQVAALSVDWRKYLQYIYNDGATPPVFQNLVQQEATARATSDRKKAPPAGLLSRLSSATASRKMKIVTDEVHSESLRILGLDTLDTLNLETPLHDIGLDSLMAVELRNALSRAFERSLPATLLFDYPSIRAISTYLAGQLNIGTVLQSKSSVVETEEPASTEDLLRQIEAMEDDDIDRLLSQDAKDSHS